MPLNLANARTCLQDFDFTRLFVENLGWSQPSSVEPVTASTKDLTFTRREVAQLSGVVVFEVATPDGVIPDIKGRTVVHKEIAKHHHENVLIFVDAKRTQSLWYWAKRQDAKTVPRSHIFVRGQSGDLLLSKLSAMVFDLSEFDGSGNVPLLEVTDRLKQALDIERVTKKFYGEFQDQHIAFLDLIEGIDDERDRRWYASVILNRLMFIYFLQRKFFLDDGDGRYLQNKLERSREAGRDLYYEQFLKILFFEGFAKPEDKRTDKVNALLGKIRYLNGGLFLHHRIERDWPNISIPDKAFENLFALFERYSWNLNDTPGGEDNEINPDVLGYIFEKYINQKAFGAYYTRPEITEYLCERTIHRLILDGVNSVDEPSRLVRTRRDASSTFDSMGDLLLALDAPLCRKLLDEILPNLRLLDPACGSAAFLVAAMKTLINVYSAVVGKIEFLGHKGLAEWLANVHKKHPSINYFIKKRIITDNLFGVDIMEEAVEIAKLRLFLALVASANRVDDLEPLPNIEFNIMAGNSLIGLMHVDDAEFEKRHPADFFRKNYRQVLEEKNELIELYRRATTYGHDLQEMRDGIQAKKQAAVPTLNDILLAEFGHLGIKYEEATWDDKKNQEGRPKKRALREADIAALKPFHWGYEFDQILNRAGASSSEAAPSEGGFDAIITNPPWEIFKPNAKEFFEEYSDLVSKKKMTIKDFEKAQAKLLKDPDIRAAWLKYLSEYTHVSAFYRSAPQYRNQISIVDGKKAGSDTNLYKLFLEQCHNLLREGGRCGIIIPSGVYTDLGTKQLREMLFSASEVDTLFGLSNEKFVFEAVHHAFKFCILSFAKGGQTEEFRAAFRINPREAVAADRLEDFLHTPTDHLQVSVDLVRRLSPDSLSVMEFKNPADVRIAEKMLRYPLLGEEINSAWNLRLTAEFHMTNDSGIFKTEPAKGRLPLYEGKMIWQFDHHLAEPRYWVQEQDGRRALLGRDDDTGQSLDYQAYRLGFRDIAASTNERTLVSTVIPPAFHGNKLPTVRVFEDNKRLIDDTTQLLLCSFWNSLVLDWMIRQRVTTTLNFFYIYQLPTPRLTEKDAAFRPIVERAARLICTTPEFDDLAKEIFGKSGTGVPPVKNTAKMAVPLWQQYGASDPAERAKLRAELDGLVAHLYGLTEEEFAYILTTFPLVDESVKQQTLNTFRDLQRLGTLPETRL